MRRSDRDALARQALNSARPSTTGWHRANCPFCPTRLGKPDRKQAFGIHVGLGLYHCFRCGVSGRLSGYEPAEHHHVDPTETKAVTEATRPPEGFYSLCEEPARSSESAEPARAYLRKRGLPESIWAAANIGVCLSGRMAGRVVVPVMSADGDWLGWVARAWVKASEQAYLYPRGMPRGEVLYNEAALLKKTDEPVLVVEGVFDALAYWPDAVAVLGKPSEPQIEALVSALRPVVVVLDGDAWAESEWLSMRLRLEGQVAGWVKLGPRVDPDEVNKSWMQEEARRSLEA